MWESKPCDNCLSKKYKVFLDSITIWEYPGEFRIVECSSCGLKYLNPRPKKQHINKYYSEKSYWGRDLFKDKTSRNDFVMEREKSYKNLYKNILSFKQKGAIFDVGAGIGLFLSEFKDMGWKVDGVEFNSAAVGFAKNNLGIKLRNDDFNKMKLPKGKFDVITFNSSLEHLYSPKKGLKKADRMLKNGGLLVITVPNIESLGAKVFKQKWLPLHPPKHLYHFSEDTLSRILKDARFEICKKSHWYFQHGYYGIFNSIRYARSARFQALNKKKKKDFKMDMNKSATEMVSLKNEIGKIMAKLLSFVLTILGSAIGKGETITVYARKT